jgi:hypothetical protein
MSRRTALWLLGLTMVALVVVLATLGPPAEDGEGPGIVGFEFAASEERAEEYKAEWGSDGRNAARLSLWLDYAYMAAYGAFLLLAVVSVRDSARRRGWDRLAAIGARLVPVAILAAIADAAENVGLLLALGGHGGDAAPLAGAVFAVIKFAALIAVIAYVAVGALRLLATRRDAATATR